MSKINQLQKTEHNYTDSPPPPLTPKDINIELEQNYYNCTECSSLIEIISINEDIIEFVCLNKENNHGKKIMSLKEYCEKMIRFNNKNVNGDICDIHKKYNNKYVSYCFDCNIHLCKECLKTRNHINHRKNNIIEIQPIQEELDIIKEVIKDYKLKKEILKEERINKKNELKINK